MGVLGVAQRRLEGAEKVTGRTRFAADLRLEGLAHVRLVLSSVPAGRIVGYDVTAALQVPGVLAVVTGEDLSEAPGSGPDRQLALGRVHFAGQPVAAVVAETESAASDAAQLVFVEYEELPVVLDPLKAMEPGSPLVLEESAGAMEDAEAHGAVGGGEAVGDAPPNVTGQVRIHDGDAEAALAGCAYRAGGRYVIPAVHQGFLEPHVAVARVEPEGEIAVWTPTQGQFMVRRSVAESLGVPVRQVRVTATPVGGGFGGKTVLFEPLLAMLARRVGRPVRLELTRTEEFLMGRGAPGCIIDLQLGADADGTLRALIAQVVFDNGAGPGGLGGLAANLLTGTYRVSDYEVKAFDVTTNRCPVAAYRAPGAPQAYFALESAVDDIARQLGRDPIELRLANAVKEGDRGPGGRPWPRIALHECLEAARRHPLYAAPVGPNEGVGIAVGSWGGGLEPAAAGCRIEEDGSLTLQLGSVDISGTNTGLAMIAAETLGVSVDQVRVESGNTDNAPYAGMAGGSKITYTVGPAVQQAVAQVREQLLDIAAEELEAAVEDLELVDGRVQVKGVPSRARAIGDLALQGARFGGKYPPVAGQGRVAIRQQSPMFTVHVARVSVDRDAGAYQVTGYAAIQDVGKALNPPEIVGQVQGGVLQGLGRVLGELTEYDEGGQLRTASFVDYGLPSIDQAPDTEVVFVEVPSPVGPFGAKGVGEPPAVPGPGAVANAIANAAGVRVTDLPIDPSRLIAD